MSVIQYTAQNVKALELACAELVNFQGNPFPLLFLANRCAHALTYQGRVLQEAELNELACSYLDAVAIPDESEPLTDPSRALSALHQLTYHCTSNGGADFIDQTTEEARRFIVNGLAVECFPAWTDQDSALIRLSDFAYVRKLADSAEHAYRLQFFTSPDETRPYQGSSPEVNDLSAAHHGSVFTLTRYGFAFAWRIHDLICGHEDAEADTNLRWQLAQLPTTVQRTFN